ncbi:MAG TPA: DUF3152 domain-containing protein [Candidatus Saccharimonadales bacterium]
MGRLKALVINWLRPLKRGWGYLLSGAVLTATGLNLVTAQTAAIEVDDCWRIVDGCQIASVDVDNLKAQTFASAKTLALTDYSHHLSYKVVFQGLAAGTDINEFTQQVAQTLADDRGWLQAGYFFGRVQQASQADFILTLIAAELLDGIPGCDHNWSCRSGNGVYINEDRWNGATTAWNKAGGNLRDYRHMVVNHEIGHYLGHGHYHCSDSPSNLAPVMQQQSIDLEGCHFNPWPLAFELAAV